MSRQDKRICLNRSVLDFMASKIDRDSFVLEFGAGWSSRWFAERCGRLVSVETSKEWAARVGDDLSELDSDNWEIYGYPVLTFFMEEYGSVEPDLILIDCAENLREEATRISWPLLKPGGWMIFDDAQRPRHRYIVRHMNTLFKPVELRWQPGDIETAKERLALAWQKPV